MAKDKAFQMDKHALAREARDKEDFFRELEEDTEMRNRINIYKKTKADDTQSVTSTSTFLTMDDEIPKIPIEELIDDFSEMKLDGVKENEDEEMPENAKEKEKEKGKEKGKAKAKAKRKEERWEERRGDTMASAADKDGDGDEEMRDVD